MKARRLDLVDSKGGFEMSLDRSLKTGGGLSSKRSVMTRGERIAKMIEDKKFDPKDKKSKPLGLPKTLVSKKG